MICGRVIKNFIGKDFTSKSRRLTDAEMFVDQMTPQQIQDTIHWVKTSPESHRELIRRVEGQNYPEESVRADERFITNYNKRRLRLLRRRK